MCAKVATASSHDMPLLKPGVVGVKSVTMLAASISLRSTEPVLPAPPRPKPPREPVFTADVGEMLTLDARYLDVSVSS